MTTVLISVAQRRRRIGLAQSSESDGPALGGLVGGVGDLVVVVAHLALDGGPGDADLHVVVDLEPEAVRSVLAGDLAEDARGGDDLVADLDRLLQVLGSRVRRRCGRIMKKYIANGISSRIPSCTMAPPPPPPESPEASRDGEKRRHNGERAYRRVIGGIPSSRRTHHRRASCGNVAAHDGPTCVDRRRRVRRPGRGSRAGRRRRAR